MKQTLWTRNFTRITAATTLGAAGGIISQFALSFLVFDETGSTLASALVVAIQLIPMVLLPLVVAPMMDRLPRKPFLVWGDLLNGLCYAGAGLFLLHSAFSYTAYLAFSLLALQPSMSWPTTASTPCCCRRDRRSGPTPSPPCSIPF